MYYIIENQKTADGSVNTSTIARASFASALSYYHERYSKMIMTVLFVSVSLLLCDADLNAIEHATIETQYKAD